MTPVIVKLRAHAETWRPYTLCYPGLVGLAGAVLAAPDAGAWRLAGAWAVPTLGWLAGLYGGDYFDRRLDATAKPHRPIPSGRVAARTALTCMIVCVAGGAALGVLLNWRTVLLAGAALAAGIAYSTVFKARGLQGNLLRGGITALALGFGALAATPEPSFVLLWVAVLFLLHDAGSNLVGTLRDVDGDREGGYETLPVRRGTGYALAVCAVLYGTWLGLAIAAPFVLPHTPGGAVFGALLAAAGLGGLGALALLVRVPRPVPRRLALRAHEILVLERVVLAGAFVALGGGPRLALPVTAAAVALTWASQRRMRTSYEFASTGGEGPAVDADAILGYVRRQLAALPGTMGSLRRWDRRVLIEITDLDLRITLVTGGGGIRLAAPDETGLPDGTVSIATTAAVFRDIFLIARTSPRHAYLAGEIRMDASPRDMIRLNQIFNEFRRRPDARPETATATIQAAPRDHGPEPEPKEEEERLPARVVISDTTLRDGEQMPGVAFGVAEKVELARRLDALGVPLIEVGYPSVSEEEAEAVRAIAGLGLDAAVQVIARPVRADIDVAIASGADSIALFAGTSDAHVRAKLRTTPQRLLERVRGAVVHAKESGRQVVFAAEDATRTDPAYLVEIFTAAADAGADAVGIADTAGVATPWRIARLVREVAARTPLPIAMHCHDDLGLAAANSVAGLLAGASAVQCSVLGIGERAGNAALEEVVLILETAYGHRTGIDLTALTPLARHVAALVGQPVPPTRPVVGGHAFTHESGLHVDGLVRDSSSYEPYPPELTGRHRRFVFGKHSGRTALRHVLSRHGVSLGEADLATLLAHVKRSPGCDDGALLDAVVTLCDGTPTEGAEGTEQRGER
jgi:isopropylmalate/homocitrate/citramalate synthase/4-hydroxybenzoate polyprenyltransferase